MGKRDTESDFLLTCCVVPASSFMKKLLPVKECLVEEILCRMKAQGCYLDGRWKDFPDPDSQDPSPEAVLAAFVDVANVIRKAAEEVMEAEGDLHSDHLGVTEWVDYHSRPPISEDKDDIGPNALLTLTQLEEDSDGMEQVRRNTPFFGPISIFNEYP